jgi:diaminopimelate epimerase
VAASLTGRAPRASRIVMDGGELGVDWAGDDGHVYLTGPAEFVFEGEVQVAG